MSSQKIAALVARKKLCVSQSSAHQNNIVSADSVLCFLSHQVEVDWDKIRAKIEVEMSKERERERDANAKSSTASWR